MKLALLSVASLCAGVALASPPWTKDAAHWSSDDVQHVLQASPWAQGAQASFEKGLTDQKMTSTSLPDASSAGLPGNKGRWDGGVGRPVGTDLPSIPITIRWDSATPVQTALRKAHDTLPAVNDRDYVIAILGLWPGEKAATSEDNGETAPRRPDLDREHVRTELMSATRLLRRGKRAIAPENVELDPASGTIRVAFPKQDPITLDEKEVVFSTQFGPLHVLKKFRLKDMVYSGKLEL